MVPLKLSRVLFLMVVVGGVTCMSIGDDRVRAGEEVVYIGAVMEYEPYNEWVEEVGGEGIVLENAKILSEYTALAKEQGADILVTPEYSLTSLTIHSLAPEVMHPMLLYLPDPTFHVTPCAMNYEGPNFEAVRVLSCSALINGIYLVVDVAEASTCSPESAENNPFENALDTAYECPSGGHIYYNTQVVFDRNGTVIARYRKKNLYLEPEFKPGTESDETAIFVTDFGVVFTLQVCFDIAYEHPGVTNVLDRGVKDVAMSTAWLDILPFFLAPSVQNGWSRHLGVNLLVSGHHYPEFSKLGSGIFRGFSDLRHEYVFNPDSGNVMIVSEVKTIAGADGVRLRNTRHVERLLEFDGSKIVKLNTLDENVNRPYIPGNPQLVNDDNTDESHKLGTSDEKNVEIEKDNKLSKLGTTTTQREDKEFKRFHLLFNDDLSNYTHMPLEQTSGETRVVNLCHEEICCSLSYISESSLNYTFMAYSGLMLQGNGNYAMYIQVCAIAWCQTHDINTCARVLSKPISDQFGPFNITGNFTAEHVFTTLLTRNLTLVDNDKYVLSVNGNINSFTTYSETTNLLSSGFFARWYARDPSGVESNTSLLDSVLEFVVLTFVKIINFIQAIYKE